MTVADNTERIDTELRDIGALKFIFYLRYNAALMVKAGRDDAG